MARGRPRKTQGKSQKKSKVALELTTYKEVSRLQQNRNPTTDRRVWSTSRTEAQTVNTKNDLFDK